MSITKYTDVVSNKFNLAPSQLMVLGTANKNHLKVRDLLDKELTHLDKGQEVGSMNYIRESSNFFIRAKALQSESFLPILSNETAVPIRPQVFVDLKLKEGDVLISKDSNIGEVVILDRDLPKHTLSGALYRLPIKHNKLYLFAFLKHSYFLKQLDLLVPKGSTMRHAKTLFLNCKIPFPNQKNKEEVILFVEVLVQSIINKEKEIKRKHEYIMEAIEEELLENQKKYKFKYKLPNIEKLKSFNRINAAFFSEYFEEKEFIVRNYKFGVSNIEELNFSVSRGQNLQVSCIGKSIFSDVPKKGFYTVIKPKHLSVYGTALGQEYLGNFRKLKTLKAGDIIFGAEGFEKGRSMVILEDRENTITNIHGITINHNEGNITLSIFLKCFLDYLRKIKLIDLYAVGGNGGSLAMKYWGIIPFPNFPKEKQKEIGCFYHNKIDYPRGGGLENYLENDQKWNEKVGIIELDRSMKKTKLYLQEILDKIVNDEYVDIAFNLDD